MTTEDKKCRSLFSIDSLLQRKMIDDVSSSSSYAAASSSLTDMNIGRPIESNTDDGYSNVAAHRAQQQRTALCAAAAIHHYYANLSASRSCFGAAMPRPLLWPPPPTWLTPAALNDNRVSNLLFSPNATTDEQSRHRIGTFDSPIAQLSSTSMSSGTNHTKPVTISDSTKSSTIKKYKCDVCQKTFSRSNTLITHKRIHSGEKPFTCEHCHRAFRQPGNLTRHRLTHTTVKPYVCNHCEKAFNRASNLHTHMRTHTNYRPFVCSYCGKGFHQKIDMKIHTYVHTGERLTSCRRNTLATKSS